MRTLLRTKSRHVPASREELDRRLTVLEKKLRLLSGLRDEVGKLKIEVEEMRED